VPAVLAFLLFLGLSAAASPPPYAECLIEAYPGTFKGATAQGLIWKDGTLMPWIERDAGHDAFSDRLNHADLRDQFSQPYPIDAAWTPPPERDFDPGRLRSEAFFRKMYGGSARAVERTVAPIQWMPKTINKRLRVTTVNGVHAKLEAVGRALDDLPPRLRKFVKTPAGTFVWRTIKGTDRLSMHSFAIAIDVGVKFSDYWKWNRPQPDGSYAYKNRFPQEIVDIFEAHGFIWGGKWAHFDTMQFEYRPELVHPACVQRSAMPKAAQ
jgi:hypothetical protein